jgi:hypothetical protein
MENSRYGIENAGSRMEKSRPGIQDKHPGSTKQITAFSVFRFLKKALFGKRQKNAQQ